MTEKTPPLAWFILFLLAIIWGSSFILIKKGLEIYSPQEVGALRIVSAGLFLLPYALVKLGKLDKKYMKILFIVGILGSTFPAILFAYAQTRITSSLAGIMNGMTPFFVLIIGFLFFKQQFTKKTAIGLLLGFAGLIILIMTGKGGIGNFNSYALFVLLATVFYGTNLNLIKYKLSELKPRTITSISLLLVLPFVSVFLFFFTDFQSKIIASPAGLEAALYVVLLGIMGTSVALNLFNRLIQISSPIFSSYVTYLIPIVALGWGIIDDEPIFPLQIIGMAIIISGVSLTRSTNKVPK